MTDQQRPGSPPLEPSAQVLPNETAAGKIEITGRDGPAVAACVAEATARLLPAGRSPRLNAIKSGARSDTLWNALAPAKAAIVAKVRADLAIEGDDAPETLLRLIDAYAEASLLRESQFALLVTLGGPVTGKGKMRVHLSAWSAAVDRENRLAAQIGFERRAKPVTTVSELLTGGSHVVNRR